MPVLTLHYCSVFYHAYLSKKNKAHYCKMNSMKHKDIEKMVDQVIFPVTKSGINHRLRKVMVRLLGDLFKSIEDLDMTSDEVWLGLDFINQCAKADEIGMLTAGLGIEHFLDMRMDQKEKALGMERATPRAIEGPLYVTGAPESVGFARLDDGIDLDNSEILFMQGTVRNSNGWPLPDARVEVWHADNQGNYSYFDVSQTPFNLRRTIITDKAGKYQFRSIVPAGHGLEAEGPMDKLLNQLGRHGQRPAHIHFSISCQEYRKLTTQITIEGSEYVGTDFAFSEHPHLLPTMNYIIDDKEIADRKLNRPFASIDFDFYLHPEHPNAPPAQVKRNRTSA